ncbi:yrdC domain-containing protein, mitochondrial [Copidosoma floridanum]|uniref:yrdC domain-containing protein, mitochondrial n=1 Tax=Copidosoma floridanum TaxID=29053 RepID=UPI000C6F7271|nr:yrdC domain-containing protein, mitochondrial [Copidosoma floridanum]
MGPIKNRLRQAHDTLHYLPKNKSWFCGGYRSAAIAAELIKTGKIVALPTDTIYGLAGLAQSEHSVARLYEIKGRDTAKPLAICLCDIQDIENWAHTEDLPKGLVEELLPGPTTLVLKRKDSLNHTLNPGIQNVGIRIPHYDFVRSIVKMVNQPLALTSANKSNTKSSLHPGEFEDLWPEVDGVFYEKMNMNNLKGSWRKGSTVVDLSVVGEFKILRKGIGYLTTRKVLRTYNLKEQFLEKQEKKQKAHSCTDNSESEDEKNEARASA